VLQEFSVETSNYDAEYGQNAGGAVNIVTRSGTNAFHADVFEYVRNRLFNAAEYFNYVGGVQSKSRAARVCSVPPQLHAGPLILHRMSPDGTKLLDAGKIIVQDPVHLPTLEGPKLYKRNGWYYIFAPWGESAAAHRLFSAPETSPALTTIASFSTRETLTSTDRAREAGSRRRMEAIGSSISVCAARMEESCT
jgi:hypothetical protein